ncbi:MAG TPA: FAD-binding oxidoreductase [Longimicrobiales bacterium]|nr:FAD-binding oxidoreductase [Longimicrobiales bacterium]
MERLDSVEQAAESIRDHALAGRVVHIRGGGTKLGWGAALPASDETVELNTRGLNRIIAHNPGDFTAVLEAGMSLQQAQAEFARAGQMLAIDPPPGAHDEATIGGILATNDSGPLRHRYGSMRDLVIGITVVLSDGTIAKSGGQVIKNVAGYDLAKLFTGSFGTLGLVARIAVRLHPLPTRTATVVGESNDPERLASAASALSRLPLEAECLDVAWKRDAGELLVRFAGAAAEARARAAAERVTGLESVRVELNDDEIWARQRARQRGGVVVKVSGRQTGLARLFRAAENVGARVASRAALGLSWIALRSAEDVAAIRRALAPRACIVLDGADTVPDPWPTLEPGVLGLMQRVKARFDPAGAFRPGIFVGGI